MIVQQQVCIPRPEVQELLVKHLILKGLTPKDYVTLTTGMSGNLYLTWTEDRP